MTPRSAFHDLTFAFCLVITFFGVAPAAARGDLGTDRDACVLKVGPDLMYFAGYQPGVSPKKFCEEVPNVGRTIFVFDYAEPELREMRADFRILRASSEGEEAEDARAETLAYLPAGIYPKGTFSFEYEFVQPGEYTGVVTVDGVQGERWVARFPFSVGTRRVDRRPFYLIAAAAFLALLLLLSKDGRRPRWLGGDRRARH